MANTPRGRQLDLLQMPPDPTLLCMICQDIMRHPWQTTCGHSACQSCLFSLNESAQCPQCVEDGFIVEDSMFLYAHPDGVKAKQIKLLKVCCPSCPWQGQLWNLDSHDCNNPAAEATIETLLDKVKEADQEWKNIVAVMKPSDMAAQEEKLEECATLFGEMRQFAACFVQLKLIGAMPDADFDQLEPTGPDIVGRMDVLIQALRSITDEMQFMIQFVRIRQALINGFDEGPLALEPPPLERIEHIESTYDTMYDALMEG